MTERRGYRVGVDIGGTFTDCAIVAPDGAIRTGKVPTLPTDRARSFFDAIAEAAGAASGCRSTSCSRGPIGIVHGTTTGNERPDHA